MIREMYVYLKMLSANRYLPADESSYRMQPNIESIALIYCTNLIITNIKCNASMK